MKYIFSFIASATISFILLFLGIYLNSVILIAISIILPIPLAVISSDIEDDIIKGFNKQK